MTRIIYFSGTGNTAFLAGKIAECIRKSEGGDKQVVVSAVEQTHLGETVDFDDLYFGFPVYACAMPGFLRTFIRNMPEGKNRPLKLFCTKAYFSGKAAQAAAELFAEKGYVVVSVLEKKMPGSDGLAFLKKNGRLAAKLLANFDPDFSGLENWVRDWNPTFKPSRFPDPGGSFIALLFGLAENGMKRKYRADAGCTGCGLCSRICPVANIRMAEGPEGRRPVFGDRCALCMRCVHQCPAEAIQIGKGTIGKFRYKGPGGDFRPGSATHH